MGGWLQSVRGYLGSSAPVSFVSLRSRLGPHLPAALPGTFAVAVLLVWAEHDGGYDQDTWYWGALALLAVLGLVCLLLAPRRRLTATARWAIGLFALYVAWSFLSITWASSPGDALNGSDRSLLYLIVFALLAILPWTTAGALFALTVYALGVGAIALDVMYRLAANQHIAGLVIEGRLAAPTGYFNSSVALFMSSALLSTALAARRELPGLVRGLLLGSAGTCLQLALIGQSRGWLFTLPFVLVASIVVVRDRFRVIAASLFPILATLIPLHRFLDVYRAAGTTGFDAAATHAGRTALVTFGIALVLGTVVAWSERLLPQPRLSAARRRGAGVALASLAIAAAVAGGVAATHGHPVQFIKRQWHGFSHTPTGNVSSSYFGTVGSGRYDFWRVGLDAFTSHPLTGLGQDNFADYYITRRHTHEEPAWPHSLEVRLLASTGIVGLLLFAGFLVVSLTGAARARRRVRAPLAAAVAGAALLPLVDWLLHGSVDWFWEIPALSGPALGFLGLALAFERDVPAELVTPVVRARAAGRVGLRRVATVAPLALAYLAATVLLTFPYLAVRAVSEASDLRARDPLAALSDLKLASELNPLWAQPARVRGAIALQSGQFQLASRSFSQAIAREPGGWFAWFGEGLAEGALGNFTKASHALRVAQRIQSDQPVIGQALAQLRGSHPLDPGTAIASLIPAP